MVQWIEERVSPNEPSTNIFFALLPDPGFAFSIY